MKTTTTTTTTTILAFLFLICAALPLYAADINDLTYDASGATVTITDCNTSPFFFPLPKALQSLQNGRGG